jgi:pilus assembly protein Flp/PilA
MNRMMGRFGRDKSGATVVEYGIIACLVAMVAVVGVTLFTTALTATFKTLATTLGAGASSP